MFISFLYMFRATMCPSSGQNTVPMRHLVLVALCRLLSDMQGPAYQTVTVNVQGCTVRFPLTGCQVTSWPRDRFWGCSDWLDSFRPSLVIRYRGKIDHQNATFVFQYFQSRISNKKQKIWCRNFYIREQIFYINICGQRWLTLSYN